MYERTDGSRLLEEWIESNHISKYRASQLIGVTWDTLHAWIQGRSRPRDRERLWVVCKIPQKSWAGSTRSTRGKRRSVTAWDRLMEEDPR